MAHSKIRTVTAVILTLAVLTLAGCAKSITVSPQQVVLTAAQPSAQVTVEMKWPHLVAWFVYNTNPGVLLVSPDVSYEPSTPVTVTASDFSATSNEKISFVLGDEDHPTAVLEVLVQASGAKAGVSTLDRQIQ